jgi:glycerophosphoryl diester phosphodiesterase
VRTVHSIGSRYQLWAIRSRWLRGVDAVAIDQRLVDQTVLAGLQRVAAAVYVWGVVDVDRALTLIDSGVHGLIVDGADLSMEIRSRLDELCSGEVLTGVSSHL